VKEEKWGEGWKYDVKKDLYIYNTVFVMVGEKIS